MSIYIIYKATAHPSTFDGPENDRTIGYYSSEAVARQEAEEWVRESQIPHHPQTCCTWEIQIRSITIDATAPRF
jgi:hypothetical protein